MDRWTSTWAPEAQQVTSAHTQSTLPQVTRLCDLSVEGDSVTSVGWSERVSTQTLSPCWAGLAQERPGWASLAAPSMVLGGLGHVGKPAPSLVEVVAAVGLLPEGQVG